MSNGRLPQLFYIGPWVFDIDTAQALITATPRDTHAIDVAAWATAYGLAQLDNPNPWATSLIGPAHNALNRDYAMARDLKRPLIVAQIVTPDQAPAPLLIDGMHRLYRAFREGVPQLPAHLLTVAETQQIKAQR
ncbi:hypothetical protein ACIBVK_28960 [Micromonospora echinofusca]|uniref:hypothetical protein n=1 Tax=Micromonospora echinofusca TaxID=47858 RepID=UPI0037A39CC5